MNTVHEEYSRSYQRFYIRGNDDYGYIVRSGGNNMLLSKGFELNTIEEARDWLTTYYPGVKLYTL